MPTKYDVFATILEKAPCKPKDLGFKSPVYAHISALQKDGWIKEENSLLIPVKDKTTENAFKLIKYCLNHGLDYNIFFTKSMQNVLRILPQELPNLRPRQLSGNKEVTSVLKYLEGHQFILKHSKRPAKGRMLNHQLLNFAGAFHGTKIVLKEINAPILIPNILQIKAEPVNPFGNKAFSFLAGSAQLEGSTISEGDTRELLLRDIYPDKPAKDIQMVRNLNEGLKFIIENKENDITPERIKELNKIVMFSLHANAGRYKTAQNRIQGNPLFKTARPEDVPGMVQAFCDDVAKLKGKEELLDRIGYLHNQLQRIHPFSDGNSRTTRMVINWILIRHGLPLLILKMGSFDEYMSLTKLSSKRDDEKLNSLFLELIVHENLSP